MNEYEAGQPGACGQDGGETVATEEVAPAEASEEVKYLKGIIGQCHHHDASN